MVNRKLSRLARMQRGFMTPMGRAMKRGIKKSLAKHRNKIADLATDLLQPARKELLVWKSCGDHGHWVEKIEVDDEFVIQVSKLLLPDMKRLDLGFFAEVGDAVSMAISEMTEADSFFSIYDPVVVDTLKDRGLKLARSVSRAMKPDLRQAMADALSEGAGLPGIREAIRDRVVKLPEWKVDRLARTEANDAINAGSHASYMQADYIWGEQWDSIIDERTSDVCLDLAGVRVAKGEQFPGGYDHPPALPNCRASIIPVFEKDTSRDPDVEAQAEEEIGARESETQKRIIEIGEGTDL